MQLDGYGSAVICKLFGSKAYCSMGIKWQPPCVAWALGAVSWVRRCTGVLSCELLRNSNNLLQLGLSTQQVVANLLQDWTLLAYTPEHLARMEAVVQQELGANLQLWVKLLVSQPRMAGCREATLRQQAQAFVAVSDCGGWPQLERSL
jgi:hypothetical protein